MIRWSFDRRVSSNDIAVLKAITAGHFLHAATRQEDGTFLLLILFNFTRLSLIASALYGLFWLPKTVLVFVLICLDDVFYG